MNTRISKLILFVVAIITLGAAYQITTLRFDYEFENFFPTDDPDLDFYYEFRDKFETDVDFVLIALYNEKGIFQEDFLSQAREMRDGLLKLPRIDGVQSPFDPMAFALGPFGPIEIPYLHPDRPSLYASDSLKIFTRRKGVGTLISEDAKSIAMVVDIEQNLSKLETDTVYIDMMSVIDQYEYDEIHMAGKVIGQAYYIDQIKFEFTLFFSIAVILVVLILTLVYRSVWGVIVPLLIVLLSTVWLLGLMGWIGKPIDIMTTLLPLVIFVVGVSDVIHLLSRYFEEIRNGHSKMVAIGIAYKQVGLATFLTSFTTALGFLTLLTSGIRPVRELGLFAAGGVFLAFILAFSLLPAILTLINVPKIAYKEPSTLFWNKLVRMIFFVTMRNQKIVLGVSALVIGLSVYSISFIEINNYFLEDVGEDDPMRISFEYMDEHFAGARPFELAVSVVDTNKDAFDKDVIDDMVKIESYLMSDYGVGFVFSPLSIIRSANQAIGGGKESSYHIPEDSASLSQTLRLIKSLESRPEFGALLTPDRREMRITGKIKDLGGKNAKSRNEALYDHFTNGDRLEHVSFTVTGMGTLIDKNNETLSQNMMTGLIFALLVVALIMGILFRSFRMALITLVPNVIPLVVIGGVMGVAGFDLKVSTSIIFGIAFGIAVDDSIHFLSKYRLELGKGRSHIWALRRTSISTGKAIILTSLILCAGFATLISSDFTSTYYVGLLISITLAVAVLADLVTLPVLLDRFAKRRNRKD